MRIECRRITSRYLSCVLLLMATVLFAQSALEPTVSKREAELLSQAAAVATTNMPQAVRLLGEATTPEASAALDFALGNFQFQQEHYEEAVAAYREAVRKWPAFRNARKNLGRVYLLLERESDAIKVYQSLVQDGLADADAFLLLGHGLMLRNRAVPAETAFRQVLMLEPDHAEARRGLIQTLLAQERFLEVRNLLRTALEVKPDDGSYWSLLANVEVALDHKDAAIRAVETARRLNACPPQLLMLLGDLYLDAGRATDAVACYDQARDSGEIVSSRFLRAVEGLIQLGEATKGAALLDAIEPSISPEMNDAHRTVLRLWAEIAVLEGNQKGAIDRYRKLVEDDPLDGKILLRLGDLLRESGQIAEAELCYERAGRLSGFKAESFVRRAQLEVDARHFPSAIELLEAAQRISPQPHVARYLEQVRRLQQAD